MTEREGLQRRPAAEKKSRSAGEEEEIGSLSPTLRRYRAGVGRRARHSAPDLSFGGKVDTELLNAYQRNLELARVNEPAVRSYGECEHDIVICWVSSNLTNLKSQWK